MTDIVADNLTVNQALTQTNGSSNNSLAGKLGVGTTAPDSKLHVSLAGDAKYAALISGPNPGFALRNVNDPPASGLYKLISTANSLRVHQNTAAAGDFSTEAPIMTWANGGNVGIGTTAPAARLHIQGNDARVKLQRTSDSAGVGGLVSFLDAGASERFTMGYLSSGINPPGTGTTFSIWRDGDTAKTDIAITNAGNVGIGTATPWEKLDVAGNVKLSGIVNQTGGGNNYFGGKLGIGTASPVDRVHVEGANPGFVMRNVFDSPTQGLYKLVCGGLSMQLRQNTAPAGDFSSESVLMAWKDGGNVGIRTDNPQAALHVKGARIRLEKDEVGGGYIDLRTDGDGLDLQGVGGPLYINAGTTQNTFLNTDGGRVGIGDRWPEAKLHVFGDLKVSTKLWCGTRKVADTNGCYYA